MDCGKVKLRVVVLEVGHQTQVILHICDRAIVAAAAAGWMVEIAPPGSNLTRAPPKFLVFDSVALGGRILASACAY